MTTPKIQDNKNNDVDDDDCDMTQTLTQNQDGQDGDMTHTISSVKITNQLNSQKSSLKNYDGKNKPKYKFIFTKLPEYTIRISDSSK